MYANRQPQRAAQPPARLQHQAQADERRQRMRLPMHRRKYHRHQQGRQGQAQPTQKFVETKAKKNLLGQGRQHQGAKHRQPGNRQIAVDQMVEQRRRQHLDADPPQGQHRQASHHQAEWIKTGRHHQAKAQRSARAQPRPGTQLQAGAPATRRQPSGTHHHHPRPQHLQRQERGQHLQPRGNRTGRPATQQPSQANQPGQASQAGQRQHLTNPVVFGWRHLAIPEKMAVVFPCAT